MTRIYLTVAATVLVLATVAGWSYRAALDRRDAQDARDAIETQERIGDALDNPSGCHWRDRLLNTCE